MHSYVLQDWITIRGTSGATIAQGESGWLDLAPYQDVNFWLDVREFSGATPSITFQTAPIKEEALFVNMFATSTPLTLSPSNPYRVLLFNATVPVARYVRWLLTGPASAWDTTFRVLVAANALGL